MRTNVSWSPRALLVLLASFTAATSLGCAGASHTPSEANDGGDDNPLISAPTPDGSDDATTDATAPVKDGGHEADAEAGTTCAPPNLQCDSGCVPMNGENCGACGNACPADAPNCSASGNGYSCVSGCMAPTPTLCNGACVDTTSNSANCGGCGAQYACAGGEQCVSSVCQCVGGQHLCGSTCVNNDANACGPSCTVCASPTNGAVACNGTSCVDSCTTSPYVTYCEATNTCVDTATDSNNCGGCGAAYACSGGEQCVSSVCQCVGGQHLCGSTCVNNDANACGPSCTVCSSPVNGAVACNGTSCIDSCTTSPYLTYCLASNACVDTANNVDNCGGCGITCPGGTCTNGTCSITFGCTGAEQTLVVPPGVSEVTITAVGAGGVGGTQGGGQGGSATATIAVTPGETLAVYVGGYGAGPHASFNGGGARGVGSTNYTGGAGGGASDVRQGGNGLGNRVVVAGGGGGSAVNGGGAGGNTTAGAGEDATTGATSVPIPNSGGGAGTGTGLALAASVTPPPVAMVPAARVGLGETVAVAASVPHLVVGAVAGATTEGAEGAGSETCLSVTPPAAAVDPPTSSRQQPESQCSRACRSLTGRWSSPTDPSGRDRSRDGRWLAHEAQRHDGRRHAAPPPFVA